MVKYCTRGGHDVAVEQFSSSTKNKDGLFAWCKPCMATYERERYSSGDRARKEKNRKNTIKYSQDKLWEILSHSECQVCGNDDPDVLEFDHREQSTKLFSISEAIGRYKWETVLAEIQKCDILCCNCHRKRTIKQLGFWRGLREN